MEEIIFSLKHYWRFVDSEALELTALSQGRASKPHEHKPTLEIGIVRSLERVVHVERSAMCVAVERQCHPGGRRDPDPGDGLDARVRGNDHHAADAVC